MVAGCPKIMPQSCPKRLGQGSPHGLVHRQVPAWQVDWVSLFLLNPRLLLQHWPMNSVDILCNISHPFHFRKANLTEESREARRSICTPSWDEHRVKRC